MRGARKKLARLARAVVEARPKAKPSGQAPGLWDQALANLAGDQQERVEYLWPENVETWRVWQEVQTQWRVGMSGMTGLDYAGVRAHLTEIGSSGDERRALYDCIRVMERETLAAVADRREG